MAKKATTTTKAKKTTAKAPSKTAAATATTAKVTTASREGFFTRVITPQVLVAEAVGTFMLAGGTHRRRSQWCFWCTRQPSSYLWSLEHAQA